MLLPAVNKELLTTINNSHISAKTFSGDIFLCKVTKSYVNQKGQNEKPLAHFCTRGIPFIYYQRK